jgi:adenylate cyclase
LKYYDKALELSPNYAKALAGRASCFLNLWHFSILSPDQSLFEMKDATYKALKLNDTLAETHLAMARYKLWYEFDLPGAAVEFEQVFKYNANIPDALAHYAFTKNLLGNSEQAEKAINKSKELDPFSPMVSLDKMASFWLSRDYDIILEEGTKTIEIHPHFWGSHWYLGIYYWSLKKFDKAVEHIKIAYDLFPGHFMKTLLGCLYALTDERAKAVQILSELEESANTGIVGCFYFTILYASMDEMNKSLHFLETAGAERTGHLIFLDYYARDLIPAFDKDPRYKPLIKKLGIPQRQN